MQEPIAEKPPVATVPVPIKIGGKTITPGSQCSFELPVAQLPTQTQLSLPVSVIHGQRPGPCLWLSAAIHGDEINGVEIIRQVLAQVFPKTLRGTLIAVPIVNVFGFIDQSRYLPDRRDLNRCFPGSPRGSLASRLAHLFMKEIVSHCTHGIDLHTASHHRANLPQIRANLHHPETRRCALAFAAPAIMHTALRDGSLRQAAARREIPTLLYEGGEALRFEPDVIHRGTQGILRVMQALSMEDFQLPSPDPSLEVDQTRWIRAGRSGILHSFVTLGERVRRKQYLAQISDAFGTKNLPVVAPCEAIVIGLTRNPLVNQGDALFHLALLKPQNPVADVADKPARL
jgi:predicted deacylase